MRSKKALLNTATSLGLELVTIISNLIIPRLVLMNFGSNYNGLTASITQFVSYLSLLTSGVGAVTTAALYKPLHDKDNNKISAIVNATEIFMRRVAIIFAIGIIIFSLLYPIIVPNDFSWYFSATLVIIISLSRFISYFFGSAYQTVITADQKLYIATLARIITTIINTLLTIILIQLSNSIHLVKLGSTLIFIINPVFVYVYVKKHYNIDNSILPDFTAIKQRWDAFGHQIANFVNNNTDIIILSIFTNLKEVSVYSVYYLIINGIKMLLQSFYSGITSAFGNMIAREEYNQLNKNLGYFEFLIFSLVIVLYTSTAILIVPFVSIYTKGITDVNYMRPLFGYLASIGGALFALQIPYQSVARGAGHFKETKAASYFEAGLNMVLSLILVKKFGLIGVTLGTVVALLYRTIHYSYYISKSIIFRSYWLIIKRFSISILNVFTIILILRPGDFNSAQNYFEWVFIGFKVFSFSSLITLIYGRIFFADEFKGLVRITGNLLKLK